MSVLSMLINPSSIRRVAAPRQPFCNTALDSDAVNMELYIANIKRNIDSGHLKIEGQPCISPSDVARAAKDTPNSSSIPRPREITAAAASSIAVRPDVFVWIPDVTGGAALCPGTL